MIKLAEGGLLDCFPDKEAPEIVALSYALQKAINLVITRADESRVYCAIEQLPERILDVLAVEMRSLYYDENLPIEKKREIVKNTMQWYTKAGTPSAVEELIQTVFGIGKIVEWFDYEEGPFIPGTFDIITSAIMEKDMIEKFASIIKKVKNARSHVRRILVEREIKVQSSIGLLGICWQEVTVSNHYISEQEARRKENVAAVGSMDAESSILNDLQKEMDLKKGVFTAAAMEGESTTAVVNDYQAAAEAAGRQQAAVVLSGGFEEVTTLNDAGEKETEARGTGNGGGRAEVSSTTDAYVFKNEETEIKGNPHVIGAQEMSQETIIKP